MRSPLQTSITGKYLVCDIEVDMRLRTVNRPEGDIELTARIFELLQLLLDEPHTLHTRESLFERVWGTTHLEDSNLSQSISLLRKALGDSRKGWIRTLTRRGYSFEPPGPVRFIAEASVPDITWPDSSACMPPTSGHDIGKPSPMTALSPTWQRFASLVLAITLAFSVPGTREHPSPAIPAQVTASTTGIGLVLVANEQVGASVDERVATRLLTEWLHWKLGWLPELTLVDQESMIAGRRTPTYVVNLTVSSAPQRRDRFHVDIDVRPLYEATIGPLRPFRQRLTLDTDAERLPAAIDAASRTIYARLLPSRAGDRWPGLGLNMHQAAAFVQALNAERSRDSARADALMNDVVRRAPQFAPALWRLAQYRSNAGRRREAGELARLAEAESVPLPTDAGRLFATGAAAMSLTDPESTADVYGDLYRANPHRIDFLIAQSRLLLQAYRPEQAMRLLSKPEWERQPVDIRIRQRVALSETAFLLGYLDIADSSANDAIALITQSGGNWGRELGTAQLMIARAHHQQSIRKIEPELYQRATRTFADAGLVQDAQFAVFLEAIARDDVEAAEDRFATALSTARRNGDHGAEMLILRGMALQYVSSHQRSMADALRLEAYGIAARNGYVAMRELLEHDLLFAALDDGDVREASERLERLRGSRLWPKYRFRIARAESDLYRLLGRHRDALAALDRILSDARRTDAYDVTPTEAANIACTRVGELLALGEIEMARTQLPGCRDPSSATVPIWTEFIRAEIAYRTGDETASRAHVDMVMRMLARRPLDGVSMTFHIETARLLTRLGDAPAAELIYVKIAPEARRQGYPLAIADVELGHAEIAAIRRDWGGHARHTAVVRRLFPVPAWYFDSRLQVLEIARLHAHGDADLAQTRADALASRAAALGDVMIVRQASALLTSRSIPADETRSVSSLWHGGDSRHALDWLIGSGSALAESTVHERTYMLAR